MSSVLKRKECGFSEQGSIQTHSGYVGKGMQRKLQTERQTDQQADRPAGRQAGRQAGMQAGRRAGGQAGRPPPKTYASNAVYI